MTIWYFIAWTAFGVLIARRWVKTSPDMMMSPERVRVRREKIQAMTFLGRIEFTIRNEAWMFICAVIWPLVVLFIWTDGNYVFRDRK